MRIEKRVRGILGKQFSTEPPLDPPEHRTKYFEEEFGLTLTPEIQALWRGEEESDDWWDVVNSLEEKIADNIYMPGLMEADVTFKRRHEDGEPIFFISLEFDRAMGEADYERIGEELGKQIQAMPEIVDTWWV